MYFNTRHRKAYTYVALSVFLILGFSLSRGVEWQGSSQLHTLMEVLATALALLVGVMALVHYYSQKNIILLFIGVGFLGASFLDGYHAIVTSDYFRAFMPSNLPSLIPWSWIASRFYLSLFLLLSWYAWHRQRRNRGSAQVPEIYIYGFSFTFSLATFLFFVFVPLPRAYYPELIFSRPEEFLPAVLFAGALVGYLAKGDWRFDPFEHWLVCALIVSVISQVMFMSLSTQLFDFEFDIAHLLKKASYIFVLTGLLQSMYFIFRNEVDAKKQLKDANDQLEHLVEERTQHLASSEARYRDVIDKSIDAIFTFSKNGVIETVNPATVKIFGFSEPELLGSSMSTILPADLCGELTQYLENSSESRPWSHDKSRNLLAVHKTGTLFPIELSVIAIEVGSEAMFVGMVQDISERVENEERLKTARDQAESASKVKSEFLASMSHEIRTPMTGIIGFADFLLGMKSSEEFTDGVQKIKTSAKSLLVIINDILDISKMDANKLELEAVSFRPSEVANEVTQMFYASCPPSKRTSLTITAKIEKDFPSVVVADPTRLRQVLINLMGNAVKFTEQGTVSLNCCKIPEQTILKFEVADSGIGINKETQARLFNDFIQADASMSRRYEGTGLGLSICKRLVELMGGEIGVESSPNEGSKFWFTYPYQVASDDADVLSIGRELQGYSVGTRRLSLLVAEDNEINQMVIASILDRMGHEATFAANGLEAVEIVKQRDFDLILMDIRMPMMSGVEATRIIKQLPEPKSLIPIIALTADVMSDNRKEYFEIGMADCVAKPIIIEDLAIAMNKALDESLNIIQLEMTGEEQPSDFNVGEVKAHLLLPDEMVEKIIIAFADGYQDIVPRIQSALEETDWPKASDLAHELKGSSGNMGMTAISANAAAIEVGAKLKDADQVREQLKLLSRLIDQAIADIRAHITNGTGDRKD